MENTKAIFSIISNKINEIDPLLLEKAKADARANKQFNGKFLNLIIKS